MTAFHLSSRRSYTRVVSSSKIRTRFEAEFCERRCVDALWDAESELDGGDHAMREVRTSWLDGSAMLRNVSFVARHRTCRRVPARQAMCDAEGEGTEIDVASLCQYVG